MYRVRGAIYCARGLFRTFLLKLEAINLNTIQISAVVLNLGTNGRPQGATLLYTTCEARKSVYSRVAPCGRPLRICEAFFLFEHYC